MSFSGIKTFVKLEVAPKSSSDWRSCLQSTLFSTDETASRLFLFDAKCDDRQGEKAPTPYKATPVMNEVNFKFITHALLLRPYLFVSQC